MRRWFRQFLRRDPPLFRFAQRIVAIAVGFTILPFLWWGESWGSYWYLMNLSSSELFKDLWEWFGPIFYIVVATIANWFLVSTALYGAGLALNRIVDDLFRGPADGGTVPPAPMRT